MPNWLLKRLKMPLRNKSLLMQIKLLKPLKQNSVVRKRRKLNSASSKPRKLLPRRSWKKPTKLPKHLKQSESSLKLLRRKRWQQSKLKSSRLLKSKERQHLT